VALGKNKTRRVLRLFAAERRFQHSAHYDDYVAGMAGFAMNPVRGLGDPRAIEDNSRWTQVSAHFEADRLLVKNVAPRIPLAERMLADRGRLFAVTCRPPSRPRPRDPDQRTNSAQLISRFSRSAETDIICTFAM
jgi:hypothetical protein